MLLWVGIGFEHRCWVVGVVGLGFGGLGGFCGLCLFWCFGVV